MLFDGEVRITDSFLPFVHNRGEVTYQCVFQCVEQLQVLKGQVVEQNIEYQIIQDESGEYRQFIDHFNGDRPYSVTSYDWKNRRLYVFYLPEVRRTLQRYEARVFSFGLGEVLLREGRMLLHASCVDTSYGGLLFSGPSGSGKSTQADLWCRYANAVQINGDRRC